MISKTCVPISKRLGGPQAGLALNLAALTFVALVLALCPSSSWAQTAMVTAEISCTPAEPGCPSGSSCLRIEANCRWPAVDCLDNPNSPVPTHSTPNWMCSWRCQAEVGRCSPNSASCNMDSDCRTAERCVNGVCSESMVEGVRLGGGCNQNSECRDWLLCTDGECAYGECTLDADCPNGETCQGLFCQPESTVVPDCSSDSDCGSGFLCSDGSCVVDTTLPVRDCITSADCDDHAVCIAGQCGSCQTDEHCGPNAACIQGGCFGLVPLNFCNEDEDCFADEQCTDGICRDRCERGERWIENPGSGVEGWCVNENTPRCGGLVPCQAFRGETCVEGYCVR